ncbi:radical SAM protein [Salinibacter sp. 10B]|uniref:PA0069 family radical SAM protein n=1 Tax=Salinibacter sp. 10B TaxID=1923971 RepID=UPI000CF3A2CD|nr:PA0069 family radical SAM protein [Salinibacter sp. 10B]PQJ34146.1 radical SAM protein [Salinibacter sp. 10B]
MDDLPETPARQGRGARTNPATQYEPLHIDLDPAALDEEERRQVETTYFHDPTQSILSTNESPDVPFRYSINPYRGCEHGCVYCYARPTHEYLGFSAGLDFETRILVKKNAPELLSETFQKESWSPTPICLSGNTDPYQPAERELEITREILRVCAYHRNPVMLITKNGLVTRDLDILEEMADWNGVRLTVSVTTLDNALAGAMEPRAARPPLRLRTIEACAAAGVPVGVNAAPIVPGLTDEEVPRILEAAAERGATTAGYTVLRLPGAVREVFVDWLDRHAPHRKERVLNRLRSLRGEDLTAEDFGTRMTGEGLWADTIGDLFRLARKKHELDGSSPPLNTGAFRRRSGGQIGLFESSG